MRWAIAYKDIVIAVNKSKPISSFAPKLDPVLHFRATVPSKQSKNCLIKPSTISSPHPRFAYILYIIGITNKNPRILIIFGWIKHKYGDNFFVR